MRITLAVAVACLALGGFAVADPAKASIRKDANIPAEPLGAALQTLATTYDFQVLYRTEIVQDLKTKGASGSLSPKEALGQVLNGTGLSYKYLDDKTVTVFPIGSPDSTGSANAPPGSTHAASDGAQEGKKTSGTFRLAQAAQGQASSDVSVGKPTGQSSPGLSEIVVTAQKKSERLQDVPVPVTVISGTDLTDTNQVSIQDYYTRVPGLSITPTGFGGPAASIRGITTGPYANPTVGIVVDDVPYGSSTSLGGGAEIPDIDPSDLARVEVLRGPQGTLYGASAMGGLIKFVTTDPSTDSVSGHIQSGISDTQNGNGLGYNVRGTVNVPLSETVAMLASGFIRQDPGYVDNIRNGQDGVNKLRVDGGRVSALWRPSEGFSLKLTAILQHRTSDGSDDVDTTLGDLQQSKLPGTGGQDRRLEVYSATLTGNVGKFDLTSITAYSISKATASEDYSPYYGSFVAPGLGVALLQTQKSDNFSQEIRLATSIGQHIDWLVGAFFTDQQSRGLQRDLTLDSLTGAGAVGSPELFTYNGPTTVSEYAGFTDLTFRITDQFDVQIGGRESEIRQTESEVETGSLVGGSSITPEVETKANAFTYLLTPRFRFSPQLMAYARLASGYRIGGPNPNITLLGLPQSFKPDKTQDYELGVKGDTLDHRLSFDASVYYIDWKDIQLYGSTDGFGYYTNASRAKSQGVELSGQARPMQWLSISAWISWNDAELKSDLPAASVAAGTYGLAGDRLPYSPRFSGGLSFDQDFNLSENVQAFVGGALSYQSERLGTFVGSPPAQRVVLPAYARTDLRAGVKCDSWRVNVFANNIANKRALLSADVTPNSFFVIQPRTIGLNVEKSF